MKKLILILLLCSCTTVQIQTKPETCCLYHDGNNFVFCIDGNQFGLMITPSAVLFTGLFGKCECEKETI